MGESFCGHGHMFDNPEGRCYRGPDTDLWLGITCMHLACSSGKCNAYGSGTNRLSFPGK